MSRFLKPAAWALLGLAALAAPAFGATLQSLRASAEASLLVTGQVTVGPDGRVRHYQVDDAKKLDPAVLDLIAKGATTWRFKPVLLDGHPVTARAHMSLRIVAQRMAGDRYQLTIHGAQFGGQHRDMSFDPHHRRAPLYPMYALALRAGANVYMALRVNSAGRVANAVVRQVNLTTVGSAGQMTRLRSAFAAASLDASKRWRFDAAKGAIPAGGYATVFVPIAYSIPGSNDDTRSEGAVWHAYIPGPTHAVPWLQRPLLASSDIDAMPDHGLYDPKTALTLLAGPPASH